MTGPQGRQAAMRRSVGTHVSGGKVVRGASPTCGTNATGPDDSRGATTGESDSFAEMGREPVGPGELRQALSVTTRNTSASTCIGFPEVIPLIQRDSAALRTFCTARHRE